MHTLDVFNYLTPPTLEKYSKASVLAATRTLRFLTFLDLDLQEIHNPNQKSNPKHLSKNGTTSVVVLAH
jgi:hypothetical protein